MHLVKQRLHMGLVISMLVLCTLLLYTYNVYLKLPGIISVQGSNTAHKTISDSTQRWLNVIKVNAREPPKEQNDGSTFNGSSQGSRCAPKTSVIFLKMHKCSSSTVQNILFRYGEENRLDFVLPQKGNYLGDMHRLFHNGFMMRFPVRHYNILCHHTRFSYRGMGEVMPSDVVYTTIIRDPVTMYESLFNYIGMDRLYKLPRDRALKLFLEEPDYYYRIAHGGKCKAKNPMLYDLGLGEALLGNLMRIDLKIEHLQRQFDLVLLTEYFDESLILLRDLMCWDLDDVVYFVLNARNNSSVKVIPPQMADKIRKWNYGDVKLYDTFNRTFWKKVEAFGHDRMRQEVAKLRQRNEYFKNHCIAKIVSGDSAVWHPSGINIDSIKLKPEALRDKMCVQMARTELPYSKHIRDIQVSKYGMQREV